jgi:hypothetical protein
MRSIEIMPKVTVYKDLFTKEQLDFFMDVVRKSENSIDDMQKTAPEDSAYTDTHGQQPIVKDDASIIDIWTPWYTFGSRSKMNRKPLSKKQQDSNLDQFKFRTAVYDAYDKVHKDYINTWKDSPGWPSFVNKWTPNTDPGHLLTLCDIEVLKHKFITDHDQEHALQFHTDTHEHRLHMAGIKQIITYTMYLNDDYEGGEIEFIDDAGNRLVTYKPKAGDITAFPAGLPYWHSARSVRSGNNKTFLRVFAVWNYEGSEEYREGVKKYGKEKWDEIEIENAKKIVDSGEVGRQVIRDGQKFSEEKKLVPLYVHEGNDIYMDGRLL